MVQAFPYITLLGFLWGTNLVISRFGVGQFDPLLFVGLRLTLASLAFGGVYLLSRRRELPRNGRLWRHATILGVFSTAVPMMGIISSLRYQSSGVTAILITTAPAIIVLMAHFFLPDERLNRYKSLGVALALSGALLLVIRGETGLADVQAANPLGYLLVFGGLIFESAGAIYIRRNMRDLDAVDVTGVRLTAAALVVLPLAAVWRGFDFSQVNVQGVGSLLYAALVGAFAAQLLAFYTTRQYGATAFSLTAYVIPVAAAVTGVILLGETITAVMAGGMVLIVIGIMLINKNDA